MKHPLSSDWQLSYTFPGEERRTIPASVPGNAELDLMNAGLCGDLMPADDPHAAESFAAIDDWTYTCAFDAPEFNPGWTQTLVFEGIDTIADIYLNGELILEARDMYIPHRVDVAGKLRPADNQLMVVIRSALGYARQFEGDVFGAPREAYCAGQPYLRKARHEWGWDNAPRLLTSGIYRPVYLESLPPERFGEIYLYTDAVSDTDATVGAVWSYITAHQDMSHLSVRMTVAQDGKVLCVMSDAMWSVGGRFRTSISRDRLKLWWPRGFGEAAMCDVTFEALDDGRVIAEKKLRMGVRTLRLLRDEHIEDDNTGEFVFTVNNERIYINGTNWKPLDAFHSRADAKVGRALELAADLNCNMIRIWGGGIYEDTPFFDWCDEHGMMVWHDFMFGCEFPPRDEWYCKEVADETRIIIEKLRNHPSLAVWCGDNEDDECMTWSHMSSTINPSDNRINREVLRECVLRFDPYRSYVASSPYASDANIADRRAGKVTHHQPEAHLYPATADFPTALRECRSRFIGETGPIGVNSMTDNEAIFERERARCERLWNRPLENANVTNTMHQMDHYFQTWRDIGRKLCLDRYGRDFCLAEWKDYCLAVNIICGDVFKDVIEYCRTERWNKTGVIWWSLLDMWPMLFNYSVVDSDFKKKLPYNWIKRSQEPFALMVVRKEIGGELALYAANDTLTRHCGSYTVTAVSQKGERRLIALGSYDEAKNSSRLLQRLPEGGETELWLIEWEDDGMKRYNHFVTGNGKAPFEVWKQWADEIR